jgi:hypothetical protein
MKVKESTGNPLSARFIVYMSLEEVCALRAELGEVPRRAAGPTIQKLYALAHAELRRSGIDNELPAFEEELVRRHPVRPPPDGRAGNGRKRDS